MHHWVPIPGPDFKGTYILATDQLPATSAVLFVHGFLGDAHETWVDFHGRIDEENCWDQTDFYFFQYRSFRDSVNRSADRLLDLVALLEKPPTAWFAVPETRQLGPIDIRDEGTQYQDLVLVGHSLGGVVLREAILRLARIYEKKLKQLQARGTPSPQLMDDGERQEDYLHDIAALRGAVTPPDPPLLLKASLRLFAPAIGGARLAGLKGVALRLGGLSGLAQASLGGSPSYAELQWSQGLLPELKQETEDLGRRFPLLRALRADVLWGEVDDIVVEREYSIDERQGSMKGKDHVSVCKPTTDYRQPLDLVSRGEV